MASERIIDLRSDTVTRPTPAMRQAMAEAEVGDDVLGDDPTVKTLEAESARLMGHEAALYLPSGTMANQVALATWCRPGEAILVEEEAHILYYEGGGPAAIAGVVTRCVPSTRGVMDPVDIARRVMHASDHTPATTLLCLENTHNRSGGQVIPLDTMAAYRHLANAEGLRIHLDGARMFNAAVALGVPVREVARGCDSVSFCLSKGLGAPVGSMLTGPADFIQRAHRVRKRLGGGMRQSGILAAAGLVALREVAPLIPEDHRRARHLAETLVGVPGTRVDLDATVTNFVMVDTDRPAAEWIEALRGEGVWALPPASHRIRLVLHHQIDDAMVDRVAQAFRRASRRFAA